MYDELSNSAKAAEEPGVSKKDFIFTFYYITNYIFLL